jgi:hypothetical protein
MKLLEALAIEAGITADELRAYLWREIARRTSLPAAYAVSKLVAARGDGVGGAL